MNITIDIDEYLYLDGDLDKLDFDKTKIQDWPKESHQISKIKKCESPGKEHLFEVHFSKCNGEKFSRMPEIFAGQWIQTEVKIKLDSKHL